MTEPMMDLRRPYRPCEPHVPVRFDHNVWFLGAAAVLTVLIDLLVGGGLVLAFAS